MVNRMAVWCFLLLAWAGAHAQHAGHGADAARAERVELAASAAFDAQGALWAVSKQGDHVMLRRSADAGKRWSVPQPVNAAPEGIGAEGDARPKIAFGTQGELYVTWTKPLSKPYTGEIRFARSLDGGKTFSAPLTVHADRQEITHRFDALTVTRDGKLFIAWVDKRDMLVASKAANYQGAAIYYAVSDNQGATFRGDFKLADHSCECCRIALLPRDDGSVLALWRHVFEPNVRDHALGVMHADGRVGDVRRATFDEWAVDICPHHGPSLAADADGRLHAVWFTQGTKHGQRSGVFYGRLRTTGEGGVDASRRVGDDTAAHADLAVVGKRIVVVWKAFDGTRSRLRAMISDNGGDTWRERDLLATAGASDQPRVLQHAGRIYAFWNTKREGFITAAVLP